MASLLWPALLTPARRAAFFYGDAAEQQPQLAAVAHSPASAQQAPAQQAPAQQSATPPSWAAATRAAGTPTSAAAADPERPWLSLDAAGRLAWATARVDAAVARLCGRAVGPGEPLLGAGLDSLTAVELRTELTGACRVELPPMLAFDYPTPAAVADCVADLMAPIAAAEAAAAAAAAAAAVDAQETRTAQAAAAGHMPVEQPQLDERSGASAAGPAPAWLRMDGAQRATYINNQVRLVSNKL